MKRKIVVPKGMLEAAVEAGEGFRYPSEQTVLEAALRWLSENPIVPTAAQVGTMYDRMRIPGDAGAYMAVAWQRIMFLAPEPEVPEEIRGLLVGMHPDVAPIAIEAFRRGQESKR